MNPKLLEFHILSDSTNKRRKGSVWTYSVRYTELFENIPFGTNTAVGNFTVYQDDQLQVSGYSTDFNLLHVISYALVFFFRDYQ